MKLIMVGFIPGRKTKKKQYTKINLPIHGRRTPITLDTSLKDAFAKLERKND